METGNPTKHLAGTLQHLCRHWESRRKAGAEQGGQIPLHAAYTITISREAGTQGTAIAKEVGRLLNWHVYDHDLLECIAKDMGLRTNLLESVDERIQSWLLETAEAFLSAPVESDMGPVVTESGFVHHLVKTVLALGVHGECVLVGRGASFILQPATTLRVRLVAPAPERKATLRKNLGLSKRDAELKLQTLDHERIRFVQYHFFKDPTDVHNYDLVVNASRLSVPESAEVIVEMLHRFQRHDVAKHAAESSS